MEFPKGQLLTHQDFTSDEQVSCDAVVVGSGAGGAAVASVLSASGLRVLILEEGRKFEPEDLVPKPSWAYRNIYAERSTRFMAGNLYIPLSGGRAVGGSTLINSGICFRAPNSVLRDWRENFGIPWADPEVLTPVFEEIEREIGVAKTHPTQARGNNLIFKAGADVLGLPGDFISRNAPGCIGCGLCQLGCPIGGKGSVDRNLIPASLASGAALLTSTRASRILIDRGAAVGLEAHVLDPMSEQPRRRLMVRADKVFLCGGSIGTPILLQRQGLGNASGQLGKNLHVHPATGMCARFDHTVDAWDGVTQGYYVQIEEKAILETFSSTPDLYFTQYAEFSKTLSTLRHIASSGVMVGDVGSGEVKPGAMEGRSIVTYHLADEDKLRMVRGLRTISKIYFAAGAREVHPGVYGGGTAATQTDLERICHEGLPATELSIYASHPMGTCRMGDDPRKSVVAPSGQLHGLQNCFVADASLFPTALGVNPQVTVMAMGKIVARQSIRLG